jgi:UDP-N-acetylglucosamine--N-acetylmuramyl-(pentapeptide) pyrophosphoryl-undecaprenol N-acetylglucosamine transferase
MGPHARVVACGLPLVKVPAKIDAGRIREIGTPVRPEIGRCSRGEAAQALGMRADAFTVFLNGGSQGGSRVYANTLVEALKLLGRRWQGARPLQVVWATGPGNLESIRSALEKDFAGGMRLEAMIQRMDQAYALADVVIGRAGASTLAEILNCGLPSILFPLPISAERHQYYNAEVLERAGAALTGEDGETSPEELAAMIEGLAREPEQLAAMARAARGLAHPNAAEDLARIVLEVARGRL